MFFLNCFCIALIARDYGLGFWRRRPIRKVLVRFLSLASIALCLQGCGTTIRLGSMAGRCETFNVTYEEAKESLNRLCPRVRSGHKLGMRGEETATGSYVLRIREGGGAPGGRWTTIEVSKASENSCSIHISSWTGNIILPSHRAWQTERKRWQELKGMLLLRASKPI